MWAWPAGDCESRLPEPDAGSSPGSTTTTLLLPARAGRVAGGSVASGAPVPAVEAAEVAVTASVASAAVREACCCWPAEEVALRVRRARHAYTAPPRTSTAPSVAPMPTPTPIARSFAGDVVGRGAGGRGDVTIATLAVTLEGLTVAPASDGARDGLSSAAICRPCSSDDASAAGLLATSDCIASALALLAARANKSTITTPRLDCRDRAATPSTSAASSAIR